MDWMEALEKESELSGPKEGFYLSQAARNNKHTAVLCVAAHTPSNRKDRPTKKEIMFQIYRYTHTQALKEQFIISFLC